MLGIDKYMIYDTNDLIYSSISKIPPKETALLLGTAKYIKRGRKNYFYLYRISAAKTLYMHGKVKYILVSGDNGTNHYDEVSAMYNDLVKSGIPAGVIKKDNAGFRTLDSVVRAKSIFGLNDYIIVSQRFHLERALYIAKSKGQNAIGFVAKDIPNTKAAYRMMVREFLARTKAFLDIYVLHIKPKISK